MEMCCIPAHRRSAFEKTLAEHKDAVAFVMSEMRIAWKSEDYLPVHMPEDLQEPVRSYVISCAYCLLADESREAFLQKGYSEDIWRVTVQDLNWHAHDGADGSYWVDTLNWFVNILKGGVIQLGRLQYEKIPCPEDVPGLGIKQGEIVANMHIPACGPMDYDQCVASIKLANEYLPKRFGEFRAFFCESWLLNPYYKKYLPPTSNIVRFQSLGTVFPYNMSNDRDALNRVFRNYHEDPFTSTPRSKLQKAVQKMILSGETLAGGIMIIMRDDVPNL